jgi:ribosomal protein L13E
MYFPKKTKQDHKIRVKGLKVLFAKTGLVFKNKNEKKGRGFFLAEIGRYGVINIVIFLF